jgi:ATP-dependent phosphofructokinase / diphosphate-dependent phosphofructokinase
MATSTYFVVQTMGRSAGWLAYGVAVAGEAHLVVGVEDVVLCFKAAILEAPCLLKGAALT